MAVQAPEGTELQAQNVRDSSNNNIQCDTFSCKCIMNNS